MPSAEADNATRTDASAGGPDQGSGALEHRIDELLKDVEQSLESLDEVGGGSTAGDAGLDVAALSSELDGALREAERVVEAERNDTAAPVAPAVEEAAVADGVQGGGAGTLEALDAALADAAVVAGEGEDRAVEPWGAGFGTPAKMVTAPSPSVPVVRVETVAQRTPHVEPVPSPIPAMVAHAAAGAHGGESAQGAGALSGSAAGDSEPGVPVLRSPGVVEVVLRAVSSPLTAVSPPVRDMIGWVGLWVAFNAVCVWAFVLIVAPGAGEGSARASVSDGVSGGVSGVELRSE